MEINMQMLKTYYLLNVEMIPKKNNRIKLNLLGNL